MSDGRDRRRLIPIFQVRDVMIAAGNTFSPRHRLVALAIADHMRNLPTAFPSESALAAWTGLDRRTVQRTTAELCSPGPVGIFRRAKAAGRYGSYTYTLDLEGRQPAASERRHTAASSKHKPAAGGRLRGGTRPPEGRQAAASGAAHGRTEGPNQGLIEGPIEGRWACAIARLRERITAENWARWFRPTRELSFDGRVLVVAVPTEQWCTHLPYVYDATLRELLPGLQIEYRVDREHAIGGAA